MDVMDSHFLSQQINMIHPHVNCDVICVRREGTNKKKSLAHPFFARVLKSWSLERKQKR